MSVASGVPLLGPTLWNINRYSEIVVAERSGSIRLINDWLKRKKLSLAAEKAEAVLLVGRRKIRYMSLDIGESTIETQEAIRYLGVRFKPNMNPKHHIAEVTAKKRKDHEIAKHD